jgi:hypothetical protein
LHQSHSKKVKKTNVITEVRVYSFRVAEQAADWPEKTQRDTRWFDATAAAALVDEGGLAGILGRFAGASVRFVTRKRRKDR